MSETWYGVTTFTAFAVAEASDFGRSCCCMGNDKPVDAVRFESSARPRFSPAPVALVVAFRGRSRDLTLSSTILLPLPTNRGSGESMSRCLKALLLFTFTDPCRLLLLEIGRAHV